MYDHNIFKSHTPRAAAAADDDDEDDDDDDGGGGGGADDCNGHAQESKVIDQMEILNHH